MELINQYKLWIEEEKLKINNFEQQKQSYIELLKKAMELKEWELVKDYAENLCDICDDIEQAQNHLEEYQAKLEEEERK